MPLLPALALLPMPRLLDRAPSIPQHPAGTFPGETGPAVLPILGGDPPKPCYGADSVTVWPRVTATFQTCPQDTPLG